LSESFPNDDRLLAHDLCESGPVSRDLVSSIDAGFLSELKAGRLDEYSALRQPRCWIADLETDDSSQPGRRSRTRSAGGFPSVRLRAGIDKSRHPE
jgi:hypothetical protein